MFSLDTNVLMYASDKTEGARHFAARQLVDDAAQQNAGLSEQSLLEFFHASTRKGKISVAEATTIIEEYRQSFTLLLPPETVIEDTLALMARHLLSIWDARLLAVCNAYGCSHLLSEDMQDGADYSGVIVINPFNKANAALVADLLTP
jgi:predicted nucleic acid-binding protein